MYIWVHFKEKINSNNKLIRFGVGCYTNQTIIFMIFAMWLGISSVLTYWGGSDQSTFRGACTTVVLSANVSNLL